MVGNTTRYALAKRVLPQQGVISPILLNFVVDKILKKSLKGSDTMGSELGDLRDRTSICGLSVNPLTN